MSIDPERVTQRIKGRLAYLYGEEQVEQIWQELSLLLDKHLELRNVPVAQRHLQEQDIMLITYGDSLQAPAEPPLLTLKNFVEKHLDGLINTIHILPFFPWSSDDGFSVTDFIAVKDGLGDWEHINALANRFYLMFDLVLNHCSRENLWFVDYLAGIEPACNYFIEAEPTDNLAMVTRPRSTPLLAGVRTHRGMRHVWATFSNDQIDLNYKNPQLLLEVISIILRYVREGASVLRLDAVAYLWKQIGTNCIHLPQTHEVIKLFRDVTELVDPGVIFITETNVPHAENISYFGDGDEAHMVYQFSLPPLLLHALVRGNTCYLRNWSQGISELKLPGHCTFLNFTASHDGVGLRPIEGLVPEEEMKALLDIMHERGAYVSMRSKPDGSSSPYELNISYFDAFREIEQGASPWHIPAFLLSQIVALSFKGVPALYIHSLLATPNDHEGVERTGMTRSINRRKLDRSEVEAALNNHESETARVFDRLKHILSIRRTQPAFHPQGEQIVLDLPDSLFGLIRKSVDGKQTITCLYNFSKQEQAISVDGVMQGLGFSEELLHEANISHQDGKILLAPYGAYWFSQK